MKCYIIDTVERWTTVVVAESKDEAYDIVNNGSEDNSKILQRDMAEFTTEEVMETEATNNNCPTCSGRDYNIDWLGKKLTP